MRMEELNFKLVAILGLVGYALYWLYGMLDLYWLRPKKIEKCLREQGFKGNPYRLFRGDLSEREKLFKEVLSKPIKLGENVANRVMPDVKKTIETHGKNCFIWMGRYPRLFITDPRLIKDVLNNYTTFQKKISDLDPHIAILFTGLGAAEGERWSKHRRIINPAFTLDRLKNMLPNLHRCCTDMVNRWASSNPDSDSVEVEVCHETEALLGDIIAGSLFGITDREEGARIRDLLRELASLTWEAVSAIYFPGKRFLPTKRNTRMRAIDRELGVRLKPIINKKMKAMQAGESTGDDFLGILLQSNFNEIKLQGNNKSVGLTYEEIYNECKLFYWSGHGTSANLIVWALVLLSNHTEWQERAREEIFQVFGKSTPHYDGLNNLKILSMILNEVLRLYPPLTQLTKVTDKDTQLGEFFIPANVQIMTPQLMLHYDSEFWGDDVLDFKPDRFSEGVMKASKFQGAYFPFSFGPRMCIGNNLALLMTKMTITTILRTFSVELSPSYAHCPVVWVSLQPQHGAPLIFRKL